MRGKNALITDAQIKAYSYEHNRLAIATGFVELLLNIS